MVQNVIFVSARRGYATKGIEAEGFRVYYPYKDRTLVGRILREIWFRLYLPEQVWYRKELLKEIPDGIIVQDPLITKKYLLWLQNRFSKTKICFCYANMVGNAKHLLPSEIPKGIEVWTYDRYDSEKYSLHLTKSSGYMTKYIGEKTEKIYDVFFVGKDKGRAEFLLDLQKQLEQMGLKTKFLITADGRFSKKKKIYSKPIAYTEVVRFDNMSKAILNVVMPNQIGATNRDMESIFNEVKLITNNVHIKEYDFYRNENIFILGEQPLTELPDFLENPYVPIAPEILECHTFDSWIKEVVYGE